MICFTEVNGLIYFDNAATTFPKPEIVYDTVNHIQRTTAVNIGRGSYRIASEAMKITDETRHLMAELVGGGQAENVVFTPSATIAANEVIYGLEWNEYKNVYVTPFEHNAIARPLGMVQGKYGFEIIQIPFDKDTHELDLHKLKILFAKKVPDYIFISQISNVTGTIVPVQKITEAAQAYDVVTIVDGSQSVGLIDINMGRQGIDYLIFAGHKNLYASWGIGGFVKNSNHILMPALAGGNGSDSLNLTLPSEIPTGFEIGSPNIIAIASLNASLKWLKTTTIEAIAKHKATLMATLIDGLQSLNVKMYLPEKTLHTSVLSFNLDEYEPSEIGTILSEDFDIAVRTGYHCAPWIHDFLNTVDCKGTVRASISYFNTQDEVEKFIDAISEI